MGGTRLKSTLTAEIQINFEVKIMRQRNAIGMLLSIVAAVSSILMGCGTVRSPPHIAVEFEDSVQGLQNGDQVYVLGLPVGEVGKPFIQSGRAIVPVSLREGSAFEKNNRVSFFIAPDQMRIGRQCLVGTIDILPVEVGKPKYRGFSSKTKLTLQMGAEKAQSWWNGLGISK